MHLNSLPNSLRLGALLALALIPAVLAGCGNNADGAGAKPDTAPAVNPAAPPLDARTKATIDAHAKAAESDGNKRAAAMAKMQKP